MIGHFRQHRADLVSVVRARELVAGLRHLAVGGAQVEDSEQRGRHGHRGDEQRQLLPELQTVEELHSHL